jgi:hypothetical protein
MANTKSVVVIFRAMQSQRGRTRLAAVTWFVPAELTIGRPSWTNQQQGSFIALQLCPKKQKPSPTHRRRIFGRLSIPDLEGLRLVDRQSSCM